MTMLTEQQVRERWIAGITEADSEWITINGKHVQIGGHEPQAEHENVMNLRSVALAHDDLKTKESTHVQKAFHNGKVVGHLASALALKHSKNLKEAEAKLHALHAKAEHAHSHAEQHSKKQFHAGFKEAVKHHISNVHAVQAARKQKHRS